MAMVTSAGPGAGRRAVAVSDDGTAADGRRGSTDATEATALLDGEQLRDEASPLRTDSWVGFEDFEGLPWWKRPSVRHIPADAV